MKVWDANQDRAALSNPAGDNLLAVCELTVNFCSNHEPESQVLKHVGFTIANAEIVALLGESGCGKTTTALSLIQSLPPDARITAGSIVFNGRSLLGLNEARLREIRGSEISIIYQDADVLNPVMRVGNQVMEVLRAHQSGKAVQMREDICALFMALGLEDCDRIYHSFPHQLSGGQRRRVAVAQALICKPRLIIADEPTAWLDSETTAEILAVFRHLRQVYGTAFLLISHDPDALMAADRVLVMYGGEIVESGPRREIFERPKHPYTTALLECSKRTNTVTDCSFTSRRLPCIPGHAPDPSEVLPGCAFSSRCGHRMDVCESRHPDLHEVSQAHAVRCFQYETTS